MGLVLEILLSGSTRSAPDFCLEPLLRGYGDDRHLLDSCALSPGRCPVAEKRAPVTSRYFGVIGDLFMPFSPTSCLSFSLYIYMIFPSLIIPFYFPISVCL